MHLFFFYIYKYQFMLVKYAAFLYTAPKLMRKKIIALKNKQLQGTEFFY